MVITNPFAHTFAIAISNPVSGMTRRWSMVPCSRSRTIAAPARMIASIVTLLMMDITEVNQAVVMLGLNSMRTARFEQIIVLEQRGARVVNAGVSRENELRHLFNAVY